ncbi:MAG: SRPBCC domain-containing protein [Pseudomonadota bacterium]
MKSVEIERWIGAGPEAVWRLLTDAEVLARSDLGILRIEGAIVPGGRLKLWSEVSPERAFSLKVMAFEPPSRMVWRGGMPFGLFTGERVFTLAPGEGGTRLHVREAFTGPLSGPICRTMPDLRPSFAKFGDGIKRLAEAGA